MPASLYSTLLWRAVRRRALARDGSLCTVQRLLGGDCSGARHVHHVRPAEDYPELALDLDNLASVCSAHHPVWEALRRRLLAGLEADEPKGPPRCTHWHPSEDARAICERRLARKAGIAA